MQSESCANHHLIDLSNAEEVAHLLHVLDCSEVALRSAVALAGPLQADVKRYFALQDKVSLLQDSVFALQRSCAINQRNFVYLAMRQRTAHPRSFAHFQAFDKAYKPHRKVVA